MRHVPHLYLPDPWETEAIAAPMATVKHVRTVLRIDPHTPVTYTDGAGTVGQGRWTGDAVARGTERTVARPHPQVRLAVAPPRTKDRQRFVVEKLQELGVSRLTWIATERCQARAPRSDRSRAWAAAALEQSRGAWLMGIEEGDLSGLPDPMLLDVDAADPLADVVAEGRTVVVGPEGGFSDAERRGHDTAHIVPTILRTETAAIAAAVLLRTS